MKKKQTKNKPFSLKKLFILNLLFTGLCGLALFLLTTNPAIAQSVTIDFENSEGGTVTGRVVQLLAILTVLSLAPSILIMMTSFTRIIVVLSFLRTALGIQQTPPNTVLVSLALFLTFFIMAPTLQSAYENGLEPLINESIDEVTAFERGVEPFKEFMLLHTREADLRLFTELSESGPFTEPMDIPLQILIPSFMISELRRAFEIGFMIFLPFLIIDMVTASILMSMGMMMLPPVMISLPFKIIFFVLVDGWYLIAGSLIQSYGPTGQAIATTAAGGG
ncbi:MAG: flagellar type III secretion system pore protein FliP [Pseudomonadota bacterium]